ncbi:hypothetical protein LX64_00917 [Chitinophaga skermanii]|uniref:Uncharacterized protein n=1 Tax=Chitinophaga skermanii TaxID=331697 RepID=A0A327QV69_9BACT|nr:hypothetical protein [Chitinophaga skermanii]RAJ08270.1 hypothetical protein LX64_00917 [Chitinophaga skermanii]
MMRKNLAYIAFVLVAMLFVMACQKSTQQNANKPRPTPEIDLDLPITQASANELVYDASEEAGNPVDVVSVEYNTSTKVVSSSIELSNIDVDVSYQLDFNNEIWKVYQADQIEQKVADLSDYDLPAATIQGTIADLEAIMNSVLTTASHEVLYSLSMNLAIFKTLARKEANAADCNCTVHPAFLVGKSYFQCQEDHYYTKANLEYTVTQYESTHGQTAQSTAVKQYLQNYVGVAVPFTDFYGLLVSSEDFIDVVDNIKNGGRDCAWYCVLGCGTSLGCCGNYKGCCLYADLACLAHDLACLNCKPAWFCGPACKPGFGEEIPDPANPTDPGGNPGNPGGGNPGTPDVNPKTSEYLAYWDYLNAVKHYAIANSMEEGVPVEYNVADLLYAINRFNSSGYDLPDEVSSAGFIERLKNFVRYNYLQYPGASYYQTSPYPPNYPPDGGGAAEPGVDTGRKAARKAK